MGVDFTRGKIEDLIDRGRDLDLRGAGRRFLRGRHRRNAELARVLQVGDLAARLRGQCGVDLGHAQAVAG